MSEPRDKSVRCAREIRDIPFTAYRSDSDGRKWKKDCQSRRALALELATYADADGTNIWPAIDTLSAILGFSRDTVFRLMKDLERLLVLTNHGLSRYHGTRRRALHVAMLYLNLYIREHYTENPEYQYFMAALREEERKIGLLKLADEPGVVEFKIPRRAKEEANG